MFDFVANVKEYNPINCDLVRADESTLHYDLFLGDIGMSDGRTEFRTDWGWVPVLDFARCLYRISSEPMKRRSRFEFTESEALLEFSFQEEEILIRSNVFVGTLQGTPAAFRGECARLYKATLELLERQCPDLKRNGVFVQLASEVV